MKNFKFPKLIRQQLNRKLLRIYTSCDGQFHARFGNKHFASSDCPNKAIMKLEDEMQKWVEKYK